MPACPCRSRSPSRQALRSERQCPRLPRPWSRARTPVAINAAHDGLGFGLQHRAARVDQAAARRKQRPRCVQDLQLLVRECGRIRRAAQQLDVRMAPDHAGRRARHIEQDALERRPSHQSAGIAHRRPPAWRALRAAPGCPRSASGAREKHRPQVSSKFSLQLQQVSGSCRPGQRRHRAPARPARRATNRAASCAAASWIETSPSANPGSSDTAMAARRAPPSASRTCSAHSMPVAARRADSRGRLVRARSRAPSWADADCWHRESPGRARPKPRRVPCTSQRGCAVRPGTVAIDLREELRVLARQASQHRIDQARGALLPRADVRHRPPGARSAPAALREYSIWCAAATSSARTGIGFARGPLQQRLDAGVRRRYQRTLPSAMRAHRGALPHVIGGGQRRIDRLAAECHRIDRARRGSERGRAAPRGSTQDAPVQRSGCGQNPARSTRRPGRCTCVTAACRCRTGRACNRPVQR